MDFEEGKEVDYMTTGQAAKFLGISRQRVHKLIQDGRLPAEQMGHYKVIPVAVLEDFKAQDRPTGKHKPKA